MEKEAEDYNSIGIKSLAEAYVRYMSMTDREKVDTGPLGSKIASAVDNVRGNSNPGEWARNVLEKIEKMNALEKKAAENLNFNIIGKGRELYDSSGLVKDILEEIGLQKVNVRGVEKNLSGLKIGELVNYSEGLLKKYNFVDHPKSH